MEEDVKVINDAAMLLKGTVLRGVYRIDSYLSSGGFGNTYVATHIDFNETYAIKEFFMKGISKRDADSPTVSVSSSENEKNFCGQLEKFKTEAKRLRKMNNDHIVRVHDLFEENGTAYYVMDYVNGENLNERLKRTKKPLKEKEVTHILHQVLCALKEVHANNIWHLDLKPANIMLDVNGNVKIIDFGASKQLNAQKGGATSRSAVSYTNGYAPLEQMEQSYAKFGPWTDFYALGATLFCLLTNKRPPMPTDIDDDVSADKHIALPMPASISQKTKQLVLWLMNTNRLKRPKSVKEIMQFISDDEPTVKAPNDDMTVKLEKEKDEPTKRRVEPNVVIDKVEDSYDEKPIYKKVIVVAGTIAIIVIGVFLWFNGNIHTNSESDSFVQEVTNMDVQTGLGECKYTGTIDSEGRPDGEGVAVFEDGRYYSGGFVNGVAQGDSVYFKYNNGDEYIGSFLNNAFGKGTYIIKQTGEKFVGTFQNGDPHKGTWYDRNGKVLEEV